MNSSEEQTEEKPAPVPFPSLPDDRLKEIGVANLSDVETEMK